MGGGGGTGGGGDVVGRSLIWMAERGHNGTFFRRFLLPLLRRSLSRAGLSHCLCAECWLVGGWLILTCVDLMWVMMMLRPLGIGPVATSSGEGVRGGRRRGWEREGSNSLLTGVTKVTFSEGDRARDGDSTNRQISTQGL